MNSRESRSPSIKESELGKEYHYESESQDIRRSGDDQWKDDYDLLENQANRGDNWEDENRSMRLKLNSLLEDLERATNHLKSNSATTTNTTMAAPLTTTTSFSKMTREYKYTTKGSTHEEPLYENDPAVNKTTTKTEVSSSSQPNYIANLSELDNLLEDLNSARTLTTSRSNGNTSSSMSPSFPRDRTDSVQVNRLISDLEYDLHHPNESRTKSHEVKPITMTKYYYESTSTAVKPQTATTSPQHAIMGSPKPPGASNATRELDDLMASLSDFKVKEVREVKEKPSEYGRVAAKPTNTPQPLLDSMIGNLQSDMSKQGVDTAAKGHCSACHKPIVGQVVTALGKTWHPEHFTCVHCGTELGTKNFFERENEPYCEVDYHNLFSPRCAYCNSSIIDKCVTALDKTWHPEHFFCAQCGKQFNDDGYHEKDGKPYCREDYFDLFAPKCAGCNSAITDNYISALNSQWHPDCFVCRDCRCPFIGGSFFDHEGQPYCEVHYHAKRGSLCAGCHKPITGRCITAMFRKFHPEHFVCSFCLKQLNKGTFKEQNDKPYCHPCFEKLFG